MSFDWLQHAFLMVTIVVILNVCVSKLHTTLKFFIKSFKNIFLDILKMSDPMLCTVLT